MTGTVRRREWEKSLTVKCRFCGGRNCKRCSRAAALKKKDSPIAGLHADWVVDSILGMMRPSSSLIEEFDITGQFKRFGIAAVFNLTLPGEHPHCGDGLRESGFPYTAEDFMNHKIQFYNFGWEDMTVPTLPRMLDIVKVMTSVLSTQGVRIAVHCHAGYGRTGLAIACVLIYMHNISSEEAIRIVRAGRSGSIQTSKQVSFVQEFREYLGHSRMQFAFPSIHVPFTLEDFMKQQNKLLHGHEAQRYRFLPKLVDSLCENVEKCLLACPDEAALTLIAHIPSYQTITPENLDGVLQTHLKAMLGGSINKMHFERVKLTDPSELMQAKRALNAGNFDTLNMKANSCVCISIPLLLDWLEQLRYPLMTVQNLSTFLNQTKNFRTKSTSWKKFNETYSKTHLSVLHRLQKFLLVVQKCTDEVIFNGICARVITSMLHLDTVKEVSIHHYSVFLHKLCAEWKMPSMSSVNHVVIQKHVPRKSSADLPGVPNREGSPSLEHRKIVTQPSLLPQIFVK